MEIKHLYESFLLEISQAQHNVAIVVNGDDDNDDDAAESGTNWSSGSGSAAAMGDLCVVKKLKFTHSQSPTSTSTPHSPPLKTNTHENEKINKQNNVLGGRKSRKERKKDPTHTKKYERGKQEKGLAMG